MRRTMRHAGQRTIWGDERGSTAIAYAIMIGLIVGAVIIGASLLGDAQKGTFEDIAGQMNRPVAGGKANGANTAETATAAHQIVAAPPAGAFLTPAVMIQCGAILIGTVVYVFVSRRPKVQDDQELDNEDPQIVPIGDQDKKLFAKREQILAALCQHADEFSRGQLTVRHLMTSQLTTVTPRTAIAEAAHLMAEKRVRHLLVCDDSRLVGVLSDRDVVKDGRRVDDVMTRQPFSVHPDMAISPAVTLMMRKRISCLPVVEDDRLCGLFTTTDLILTLQCAFQLLQTSSAREQHRESQLVLDLRGTDNGRRAMVGHG